MMVSFLIFEFKKEFQCSLFEGIKKLGEFIKNINFAMETTTNEEGQLRSKFFSGPEVADYAKFKYDTAPGQGWRVSETGFTLKSLCPSFRKDVFFDYVTQFPSQFVTHLRMTVKCCWCIL